MKASVRNRLLVALAAVVMLPAYITPLWSIHLRAPQYPEGLGMYIGVSEVRGHDTHDLQNINILNHYIGMKPIEPDAIPELTWMPWILAGLIISGLLAALVGRRWFMAGWLGLVVVVGIAGLVDFYLWKYDFGHNLSPDAPIKVPGMTYQPPLIGRTQLLNITATSLPQLGTFFLTLSAILGAWGVVGSFRRPSGGDMRGSEEPASRVSTGSGNGASRAAPTLALLLAALWAVGCGAAESPGMPDSPRSALPAGDRITYGVSQDPYCGGVVEGLRWGGEIRTRGGEIVRFRSVECLAGYLLEGRLTLEELALAGVVDFPDGRRLLDPTEAIFLHTPILASPAKRGLNIMAISTDRLAVNLQEAYAGTLLRWDDVLELVGREWGVGGAGAARDPSGG